MNERVLERQTSVHEKRVVDPETTKWIQRVNEHQTSTPYQRVILPQSPSSLKRSPTMRIHLDDEYLIDGDERSCNLVRLRTVTGESTRGRAPKAENIGAQREEVMGFYATLAQACQGYLRCRTQGGDATTAEQIIAVTEAAVNAIIEATNGLPNRFS